MELTVPNTRSTSTFPAVNSREKEMRARIQNTVSKGEAPMIKATGTKMSTASMESAMRPSFREYRSFFRGGSGIR